MKVSEEKLCRKHSRRVELGVFHGAVDVGARHVEALVVGCPSLPRGVAANQQLPSTNRAGPDNHWPTVDWVWRDSQSAVGSVACAAPTTSLGKLGVLVLPSVQLLLGQRAELQRFRRTGHDVACALERRRSLANR